MAQTLYKYFICFNDDGSIQKFCIDQSLCDKDIKDCEEFVVKLIPIDRESEERIQDKVNDLTNAVKSLGTIKKLDTAFDKIARDIKQTNTMLKNFKLK